MTTGLLPFAWGSVQRHSSSREEGIRPTLPCCTPGRDYTYSFYREEGISPSLPRARKASDLLFLAIYKRGSCQTYRSLRYAKNGSDLLFLARGRKHKPLFLTWGSTKQTFSSWSEKGVRPILFLEEYEQGIRPTVPRVMKGSTASVLFLACSKLLKRRRGRRRKASYFTNLKGKVPRIC